MIHPKAKQAAWTRARRALYLIVAMAAWSSPVVAAPVFRLALDPGSNGQTLTLAALASDVTDLYGFQFTLNFDPARVRFVSAQEGPFLAQGGTTFFDRGTADNAAGTVSFVFDTLIGAVPGVSGSGLLARFGFATVQPGLAAFSLSDVLALDSTLDVIDVQAVPVVIGVPEPWSGALLLLGAAAFVAARRRARPATASRPRHARRLLACLGCVAACGTPALAQTPSTHWVGTWTASVEPNARTNLPGFADRTLRFVLRTSIGGKTARIQLSNVFGTRPLEIGSAHLALHGIGPAIVPGSDRVLTFGGSEAATVPARGVLYSDPVDLDIPELGDVVISLYLPGPAVTPVTGHSFSLTTNYTSVAGNYTGNVELPVGATACFTIAPRPCITPWYYITRLEVLAPAATGAIVTLGDSITDGDSGGSPVSSVDRNVRWPATLATRLLAQKGGPQLAVLNAGISGNNLRGSNGALDRLERDVLSQAGVKYVVLLEGINDSSAGMIADQLIGIDQQIVDRVHAAGLKIYGATLTPAGSLPGTVREYNRSALSNFIRTSRAFDGVIDFDRAMADPTRPTFMVPAYDSGDHTHPSAAGYAFMGNFVDLGLFKGNDGPYPWSGVTGDVDGDGVVTCNDLAAARAVIGTRSGTSGYAPTADVDGNGTIDLRDISGVARLLPVGTRC